jgi:hypothetical protein
LLDDVAEVFVLILELTGVRGHQVQAEQLGGLLEVGGALEDRVELVVVGILVR